MVEQKIILVQELSNYGPVTNLNEQAFALIKQQRETWELARKNYDALSEVQTRSFDFGHFKIVAQHNPVRIRSSAAKVDAKSIAERPCFLCQQNLPKEQKALVFHERFLILVNPFPVFPLHLTIPLVEHKPQEIFSFFPNMLELSKELEGFTLFYNGPQCGASAPDHFHFQAGNRGFLPIEKELASLLKNRSEIIVQKQELKIIASKNNLRKFLCIDSPNFNETTEAFFRMFSSFPEKKENEPMINILSFFEKGRWRVIIFPREKLRPSHFYREDENQLVVSPASVELGGILVLPRKEDFNSISNKIVSEIYNEVTLPYPEFEHSVNYIINAYR